MYESDKGRVRPSEKHEEESKKKEQRCPSSTSSACLLWATRERKKRGGGPINSPEGKKRVIIADIPALALRVTLTAAEKGRRGIARELGERLGKKRKKGWEKGYRLL